MRAKVTMEVMISNLGELEDWLGKSFDEGVRLLIEKEGLFGICDDDGCKIIKIEEVKD